MAWAYECCPCDHVDIDPTLRGSELIADAVKRSVKAHLFHFHSILCEIVSIPRKTPTSWTSVASLRSHSIDGALASDTKGVVSKNASSSEETKAVELDARTLAKECLKEIGMEMGLGR